MHPGFADHAIIHRSGNAVGYEPVEEGNRMNRLAIAAALAAILCVPAAWTQDTAGESSGTELADGTPAQNASPGSVRQRAPGTWINAARARHSELIEQRVNGPRFGQFVEDDLQADSGSSSLGSGFASSGGAVGSGTSGTTSGIPDNIPPEVIQMIEDAGIDTSQLFAKGRDDDASGTVEQLPEKDIDSRAQSQDDRKFHVRLADSLLSTFFTAVTVGFQSRDFIDALTGFLRPIFAPPAEDDAGGDQTGDTSGDTGSGTGGSSDDGTSGTGDDSGGSTTGGDTGSSSGGGIEDIQPGDSGSNDQSDSVI